MAVMLAATQQGVHFPAFVVFIDESDELLVRFTDEFDVKKVFVLPVDRLQRSGSVCRGE
jgi:hypothetical protein